MSFAQFYISTTNALTSTVQTMFGLAGWWKELPDVFPPILWIRNNSTSQLMNEGLYILTQTTGIRIGYTKVRVDFEPGTKWFVTSIGLDSGSDAEALGGGIVSAPGGTEGSGFRIVQMYYRTVGEGPDPNRQL